ncbi:MAG: DUF6518 family protein [Acidimicrobiales bacterium]
MTAAGPDTTADAGIRGRWWWLVAITAGLLLGPLDLWGQVASPYPWANLFNSPSVWAAAAFGYGRWLRRPPVASIGGVVVLVVGVESYYLADVLVRDASRSNLTSSTAMVWLLAGIVAGVVFGMAGSWASDTSSWRAVLGRSSLPAVFGAEAMRNAVRLVNEPAAARPDDLGTFAVLLAVCALVSLILLIRGADRRSARRVAALSVIAAVAVGAAAGVVL